ncbi:helix-turn-helix domain-containing protein [Lactococcus garvieae]|uniref:AraC family transcriptional regulator n=1 Tax=Lactococcus garvieae TaxID=1363 RepID=UPI00254D557E|nr:helix-turn-helix domain-containing protein [Lactococcus garvieae]
MIQIDKKITRREVPVELLNDIAKEYLFTLNNKEISQRKDGNFVFDYPTKATNDEKELLSFSKEFFIKNNQVFLSKHNRFADYPEHDHEFFEFNYMLNGSCHQKLNGKEIILNKGDLILLDPNCRHSIKALGQNDILINIIFPHKSFDINWINNLGLENNTLFNFLMNELSTHSKGNYIKFETSCNENVEVIIHQLINKFYTGSYFSNEIMKFMIPILFMELIGNTPYELNHPQKDRAENHIIAKTLQLISEEYFEITLEQLANRLHYNKNYLSNLIKKKTGHTFTEHLVDERMKRALLFIQTSSDSISDICEQVGINNKSYFYRLFKEHYGHLPTYYRK